ncbi:MAG: hypothetical protein IJ809_02550 [Clostridia bacterium]|nr:hypothetical protein [Clostridia bacterium]
MKRSESQSLYNALPGACITFSSNASEGRVKKLADKKVLKISYWNTKNIKKEDIYYPKIVSQIIPDLYNFRSDRNENVNVDGLLKNLFNTEYRDRINFLEIDDTIEKNQIVGHIFPLLFYCSKCGKIKFLKSDKDIVNMVCECTGKARQMEQYNRIWVCACGKSYPIDSYQVNEEEDRYFASIKDKFVRKDGSTYSLSYKKCTCGNNCSLENATDPKAFYPRIITSVNLTEHKEALLCKINEGKKIIVDRHIGKIGQDEFKSRKEEILKHDDVKVIEDFGLNDDFDFFKAFDFEKENETNIEEETLYRLLEYNTIKGKVETNLNEAINNAQKFEKITDKSEILTILEKLKISDICSVSNIEIINTAYGYTRKYYDPDEMPADKNEKLVLCAFHNYKDKMVPNMYNIRTKTEGILIDVDKRALYNYLNQTYSATKQFRFKELNSEELNRWFLDKINLDTELIKKFEDIDTENGNMTSIYTKCIYTILHTISHMFINTISKFCGIEKNSLSEMIFLNSASILIYSKSNQGAVLGALTQTFNKYLYEMLNSVYSENETCTFDPLCINSNKGSCCACTYLDEVACEHFNKDLSRRILYGFKDNATNEEILNFWEEI